MRKNNIKMNLPKKLDGAEIIWFTENDNSLSYGSVYYEEEDREENITALAICQYSDSPKEIYLFACSSTWKVIGDTLHDSIKEAKELAEQDYKERVETITSLPAIYTLIMAPMIRQSTEAMERMSEEDRKRMDEILAKSKEESSENNE